MREVERADGGRRQIVRGTVTREPGKGVVRQDGRRVLERDLTASISLNTTEKRKMRKERVSGESF